MEVLRAAVAEKNAWDASSPEWQAAYETAQERLHARYPRMVADAILWRATFLDALIGRSEFEERHRDDGKLPTTEMLEVAATIATYGDEEGFNLYLFEEHLAQRERGSSQA